MGLSWQRHSHTARLDPVDMLLSPVNKMAQARLTVGGIGRGLETATAKLLAISQLSGQIEKCVADEVQRLLLASGQRSWRVHPFAPAPQPEQRTLVTKMSV